VETLRAHGCRHELALAQAGLARAQRLEGAAGGVRLTP
jgi:hypothetical protein